MRKFCDKHIHALNAAIKKKGMGAMVSQTDWEAKAKATRWLRGATPEGEFDPLVVSFLEVQKKAAEMFGNHMFSDECPLCAANRILMKTEVDKEWIDNVSDMMLAICLANGLIKRPDAHNAI